MNKVTRDDKCDRHILSLLGFNQRTFGQPTNCAIETTIHTAVSTQCCARSKSTCHFILGFRWWLHNIWGKYATIK